MIIKFQILKSIVIDQVKSTTYIKGKMDESQVQNGTKLSYNEIAGDDEVHERMLTMDFDTALEKLKTIFVDYLVPTPTTIGDNVIYYDDTKDDIVEFTLNVSRRYNGTLTDALARLSAKYVVDWMIYQWWLKTTNLKQAEPYQAVLPLDEQEIRKCFVLSGPIVPKIPYTDSLDVTGSDGSSLPNPVEILSDSDNPYFILKYSIKEGALDDIEAHSSDPSILEVHRSAAKQTFILQGLREGEVEVTIFSRHNDVATKKFNVNVKGKEE